MILGKVLAIGFVALCIYFFCDGKKNPHKYAHFNNADWNELE